MKQESGLIGAGKLAVVNAADNEIPIARNERAGQLHDVAELPVKTLHQLSAYNASVTFFQILCLLLRRYHKLRIHVEIAFVDREIGEPVAGILIIGAEPIAQADALDAGNFGNLL